jgi:undecaprenyl-diphosphatase
MTASAFAAPRSWDLRLFAAIYSGQATVAPGGAAGSDSALLHRTIAVLSVLGDARTIAVLVATAVGVLLLRGRTLEGGWVVAASAVVLAEPLLKQTIQRWSPFETGYSYPSGHAIGPMALLAATVPLLSSPRRRWMAAAAGGIVVGLVGLAAVSDGGHWPSDVIGGWALALAWSGVLALLLAPWRHPMEETG